MDTVRTPNADQERMQAGKRLVIDAWTVELLPRRPYEVTYTPEEAVVGFALESQVGVHAFSSDRVCPFSSKPNGLAYVPAGCTVFSSSQEGGEYLRLTTSPETFGETGETLPERQFNDFIDPIAIHAAQIIRNKLIADEPATLLLGEQIVILSERVKHVLKGHASQPKHGRSITPARLRLIDEIIESSLNADISIRFMADTVGLSEAFFIRAFKAATGKSPHSYLIDRRLAKVRKLLETSQYDLREIALAVGFSSHAHMTAAFRARFGITPSRLRRN